MGIHSTFFAAWRGEIEPTPGEYDYSSVDGPVDAALACGVEPLLKVTAGGRGQDSTPPDDMAAYSEFVFSLAEHMKGRVSVYAIENEINNPRMVWTGDTYGPLRAAAYEAIKRADPDAEVLDGGLTMEAYITARAAELQQAGKSDDALAMLNRFQASMRRSERQMPDTASALVTWLERPQAQRNVGLMDEMRAHPETFDAVQIHYLQDAWDLLPEYISWVRAWFPGKPFEFWEIGFGWEGEENNEPFTEQAHAEGVVKTLVVALGEGAARVVYEPYNEGAQAEGDTSKSGRKYGRGLVTSSSARLAATAYETMAGQLGGYQQAERVSAGEELGTGVWAYRFTLPAGKVYVLWATQDIPVQLQVSDTQVTETDINGHAAQIAPSALTAGASPVFIRTGN